MDERGKAKLAQEMGNAPKMKPPEITDEMVKNALTLECSCGGVIFQNGVIVKKISAFLSPTGEQMDIPITVIYCKECGLIPPDSDIHSVLPPHIKSERIKLKL